MKKVLLTILIAVISLTAFAQEENNDFSIEISDKMKKADRLVLDYYYQMWQDVPDSMDLYGVSRGFNVNMMIDMPIASSRFSFAYGFGFGIYNMYSDAVPVFDTATGKTSFSNIPKTVTEEITFKTNKLTTAYVDLPLEFRYRHTSGFKVSVFGKIGYLINSHTKYNGDDPNLGADYSLTTKVLNIPNIQKYRMTVGGRIGYKKISIFGSYSITKMFGEHGPQMYPINVGITLSY
jgi:Outer membrane protein beta-barrel domain